MGFQFASCQWNPYAKGFLQKMYPSKVIDDETIPLLVELVNADVLRIQDPDFHRPCQIVAGTNYESRKDDVQAAIEQFKKEVHGA